MWRQSSGCYSGRAGGESEALPDRRCHPHPSTVAARVQFGTFNCEFGQVFSTKGAKTMIDTRNTLQSLTDKSSEQLRPVLERIFAAAQPVAGFGEPVVSGNYTIITASEVPSAGASRSGRGFGQ